MAVDALTQQLHAALAEHPNAMTMQLARQFDVPEAEIIRRLPGGRSVELDVTRWEPLIHGLEAFGNVHVIVSNGACTLEATGKFGNFSQWGEFFNVQTKLDMHIRWPNLGSIFAVEKPSHMDGVNTYSIQFFDKAGQAAFKVFVNFGQKPPTPEQLAHFEHLRSVFAASAG